MYIYKYISTFAGNNAEKASFWGFYILFRPLLSNDRQVYTKKSSTDFLLLLLPFIRAQLSIFLQFFPLLSSSSSPVIRWW